MKRLLVKGGKLLDIQNGYRFDQKEIYIESGVIKDIGGDIRLEGECEILELAGQIVTPGFIDIHTHVYPGKTNLGIEPDVVGINTGVTTVFDAGSAGAENFRDFYSDVILKSTTGVYSLINIALSGLERERYELADIKNIDVSALKEVVKNNREHIKGIKARASATAVGDMGLKPIEMAKKAADELGLPLMVHIGNYPPDIRDVLNLLDKGDIVTHCFHGKPNGLLDENGNIRKETERAISRGVMFDIGHGTSSFNYRTAKKAAQQGFYPDIISTDIYRQNYRGPVYSLAATLNKIMALGVGIEECIRKVTAVPAETFGLMGLGQLRAGYSGDLTVFYLKSGPVEFEDSDGNTFSGVEYIEVTHTVKNGRVIEFKQN
ncbi:MAG: amidohydrolase/deacetylase family metallohydrolase [Firmicutes bacterium]|nr:amidohydrolase/deacetylase family metallohydrolase [Bacillota bacterium]